MSKFSDISRLLNVYQLWLDDLYPRAKFADGLAIIEKLGHKKTIQMKRKEWVDESKPRPQYEGTPEPTEEPNRDSSNVSQQGDTIDSGPNAQETLQDQEQIQDPDQVNTAESEQPISTEAAGDEMDDLDALLAEDAMTLGGQEPGLKGRSLPLRDDFDDEMEAMAGLDNPW
ncbi:MAG: chromosome segregation in meiosis- protein [Bathelium mastoideum]|nr:MAG: chromosome segregation in meiosis- protein [Bathelium mastoideum]